MAQLKKDMQAVYDDGTEVHVLTGNVTGVDDSETYGIYTDVKIGDTSPTRILNGIDERTVSITGILRGDVRMAQAMRRGRGSLLVGQSNGWEYFDSDLSDVSHSITDGILSAEASGNIQDVLTGRSFVISPTGSAIEGQRYLVYVKTQGAIRSIRVRLTHNAVHYEDVVNVNRAGIYILQPESSTGNVFPGGTYANGFFQVRDINATTISDPDVMWVEETI